MTFSVVIPVYNVAPYLRDCLDSVMGQTYPDWEAICVDDGSTDASSAILDEYAARDARIHAFHRINAGVSAARNFGIAHASGDYVTFLDGDDFYEKGWLAEAARIITETNADLVRLDPVFLRANEPPCWIRKQAYDLYPTGIEVKAWGERTFSHMGWSWLLFIRRTSLATIAEPFPVSMRFMEDNIFSLRLLGVCTSAAQGSYEGYGYRQRDDSACMRTRPLTCLERLFDEVTLLCRAKVLSSSEPVTVMLTNAILFSRPLRDRRETNFTSRVFARLTALTKEGVFDLNAVPLRWRLGFSFLLRFRSFLLLDFLLFLQSLWGKLRPLTK